ncbi:hypothetical protein PROCOU_02529 [Listeria rocourtiae FSL F6-920]|nr:hypothetical protein PROCOU_02529 [Listeria rocourtiae FSL F6-920]
MFLLQVLREFRWRGRFQLIKKATERAFPDAPLSHDETAITLRAIPLVKFFITSTLPVTQEQLLHNFFL